MSTAQSTDRSDEVALFLGNDRAGLYGRWMIVGGCVLFAGTIALFALLLLLPVEISPGPSAMTTLTVPPILAALVLIGAGWSQVQTLQQVDVGPDGVTIHFVKSERHIPWDDVVELQTGERSASLGHVTLKTVKLIGPQRKVLAAFDSQLQPFDDLVTKLWERASVGREVEVTDTADKKKRSEAWLLVILGPVFAGLGLFVGLEAQRELQQRNSLRDHPTTATATVIKHEMFNVTPRLEYQFQDAEGEEHRRNTIVATKVWNQLQVGSTVAVKYLSDDPEYSRLDVGDIDDEQSHDPQLMVFCAPLVGLMGAFFFIAGVLQFCGIDLEKMLGLKSAKKSK
jgi:hypothetical protein